MIFNLFLLADATSEAQKKWMYILLALLLIVVVIIGLITYKIKLKASEQAKEIDAMYVSDYCKEGLLKTPKEVVKYVRKREFRSFYMKSRFILRAFLTYTFIYLILMAVAFNNNYAESLKIIDDMFWKFDWHLVSFYKIFQIPTDFPTVISNPIPHLTFQGYLTYVYFFLILVTVFLLLRNGIFLTAKLDRSKKISIDVFGKTIDTSKEVAKL